MLLQMQLLCHISSAKMDFVDKWIYLLNVRIWHKKRHVISLEKNAPGNQFKVENITPGLPAARWGGSRALIHFHFICTNTRKYTLKRDNSVSTNTLHLWLADLSENDKQKCKKKSTTRQTRLDSPNLKQASMEAAANNNTSNSRAELSLTSEDNTLLQLVKTELISSRSQMADTIKTEMASFRSEIG